MQNVRVNHTKKQQQQQQDKTLRNIHRNNTLSKVMKNNRKKNQVAVICKQLLKRGWKSTIFFHFLEIFFPQI